MTVDREAPLQGVGMRVSACHHGTFGPTECAVPVGAQEVGTHFLDEIVIVDARQRHIDRWRWSCVPSQ